MSAVGVVIADQRTWQHFCWLSVVSEAHVDFYFPFSTSGVESLYPLLSST